MRGLAMTLVVMGHCGTPLIGLIYSFHVPLFFILSGYLYKGVTKVDFFKRVKKKIYRLYVPCMLMVLFLTFTNNIFIDMNILCTQESLAGIQDIKFNPVVRYTAHDYITNVVKAIAFTGVGQLSGALWFLRVMFVSSIFFDIEYMIIYRFAKRKPELVHLFANSIFFIVGYIMSYKALHVFGSLEIVCSILIFYNIGIFVKQLQIAMPKIGRINNLLIVAISFILLFYISEYETVDIARNNITNPVLLLLSSVIGFVMTYHFAKFCSQYRWSSFLSYIGKNTVAIMCWHFIAFKIVNYLVVRIEGLPAIYIARFPVSDYSYWPLYILIGVFAPLVLAEIYSLLKIGKSKIDWLSYKNG